MIHRPHDLLIALPHMTKTTPDLSHRKRLQLIDFYLYFFGKVQRTDLILHFDIGIATATRTLKEYRSLYPDNIEYDVSSRSYKPKQGYRSSSPMDPEKALMLLAYGLEVTPIKRSSEPLWSIGDFTAPLEASIVSTITTALVSHDTVSVTYSSGTSGESERSFAPHSTFKGGGAWYVRGYDYKKKEFRTFRLSRIVSADPEFDKTDAPDESMDAEWNDHIVLSIGPHPKRKNQQALKEDLGLTDKPVKNLHIRECLAGFAMNDLRVDCSEEGSLNPYEYHLRLLNRHEVKNVGSMIISPGFA